MNHYCTYFDRGFLSQGLALWRSLAAQDVDAVLWVLALDEFTADILREVGGTWLRVVRLEELEKEDRQLAAVKSERTRVEYFFTLSPCWPRWLLKQRPEIGRLTYVDADLFFFDDPREMFEAMDAAGASVMLTAHRFPAWLAAHYEQHGKFNVGILSWRRDAVGLACLDEWRAQCLAWCFDRVEDGKYADQKYLDGWPARWGAQLLVLDDAGVNAAPWNWAGKTWAMSDRGKGEEPVATQAAPARRIVTVEDRPLVVFHFARFRPLRGAWWWQSGQLDYGVMPGWLRNAIYGPYARALLSARDEIAAKRPGFDFPRSRPRGGRGFWRDLVLRGLFGSDWLRAGGVFFSGRAGLGRWSGRVLASLRRRRQG